MRRPGAHAANQKPKPKFAFAKAPSSDVPAASSSPDKSGAFGAVQQPAVKMSLADWAEGDGYYYEDPRESRERGGRRKKKKKKAEEPVRQDWDDLYDPTRPNNYEEYMHSEERVREIKEWKERLYAHRLSRQRPSSELSSDEDDDRPRRPMNRTSIQIASSSILTRYQINLHLPHLIASPLQLLYKNQASLLSLSQLTFQWMKQVTMSLPDG
jgi:hypothetical protein